MVKTILHLTGGGHICSWGAGQKRLIELARQKGWRILGARDGWAGLNKGVVYDLTDQPIHGIELRGGSFIGSSRTLPDPGKAVETLRKHGVDAVVAMGGDDTLGAAYQLYEERGVNVVGWPKTMDNDLFETYCTLGYPSAASIASANVRDMHDAAWSHSRVALVTLFGRNTDWAVAAAGAYGLADMVVPCEQPYEIGSILEKVKEAVKRNREKYDRPFAVVAVAEGASIGGVESHVRTEEVDAFGNPKLDPLSLVLSLERAVKRAGFECAVEALTYRLRNGMPTKVDAMLAEKASEKCVDLVEEGAFGHMAAVTFDGKNLGVGHVPLKKVIRWTKSQSGKVTTEKRPVKGTGYVDYDEMTVTPKFVEYAAPFLGKPAGIEEVVYGHPLKPLP
ncbi:MAG: 6-phosphofructokinase [Candidatus Brockarchaeota archaeon]|nr:6-phosphofructokinase [Candidatus Brockarchaeota archaeon]